MGLPPLLQALKTREGVKNEAWMESMNDDTYISWDRNGVIAWGVCT